MIGSQYKRNNVFKRPLTERDKLTINGEDFRVKIILNPIGNPGDDRLIYMSIDKARELFGIEERVDTVIVQVEEGKDVQDMAERIRKKLFNTRGVDEKTRDFSILTPEELIEVFGVILNIITGFLVGVAAISLLVGGIGIANTMYTSVLERTKEIGIMKSIGAKNSDVFFIFVIESGLLGLVGGIFGVLIGVGVGEAIEYIAVNQLGTTLLAVATPAWLFVGSLMFAFLAGAISGSLPAVRASKINPVDALRYE